MGTETISPYVNEGLSPREKSQRKKERERHTQTKREDRGSPSTGSRVHLSVMSVLYNTLTTRDRDTLRRLDESTDNPVRLHGEIEVPVYKSEGLPTTSTERNPHYFCFTVKVQEGNFTPPP